MRTDTNVLNTKILLVERKLDFDRDIKVRIKKTIEAFAVVLPLGLPVETGTRILQWVIFQTLPYGNKG